MPKKYKKTADSHSLDEVKGSMLDHFLAMGWYRMGPTIFTTHYIFYNEDLFSTIWLRTPLTDYTYSKSLKKILRKNNSQFTYDFEPYSYASELDELYEKYKLAFKGNLPESLERYMMDSLDLDIYDTYLVKVYSEDVLIACSIFDLGEKALSSLFGFYDPEFSAMSLGIYTMLLEIEFALQNDMELYYIGYFVPGNPRFDYKLRIGHIEHFDFKTSEWYSFDTFDYEQTPIKIIRRKLDTLYVALNRKYDVKIYQNAFIDVNVIEFFPMRFLEDPLILLIQNELNTEAEENLLICIYDVRAESYKLYSCQIHDSIFSCYNHSWIETLDDETFKYELVIKQTLKVCKTVLPIERSLEAL